MKLKKLFAALAFAVVICGCDAKSTGNETSKSENWLEAPSLKEAFVDSGIFDCIGLVAPSNRFGESEIKKGVSRHANSITLENEFKPDPVMGVYSGKGEPKDFEKFTSSKGVEIRVPKDFLFFNFSDDGMYAAKKMGVKMRGHVLVWHSQTPAWFFKVDYSNKNDIVSKDEMDARQEWYIKSVLEHVKNWEDKNNGGERIIYCWDVVNEALADDANETNYIRGSTGGSAGSSMWYKIFNSDEFIINAFRYANKYAPKDVLLAYNDYNEYMGAKHTGMVKLVNKIKAAQSDSTLPTRIDVIGMQSHYGANFPSPADVDEALKHFVDTGLDIHITELDINSNSAKTVTNLYTEYFKIYKKYAKSTLGTNGITSVTLWGINDENSWIYNNGASTPLLFKKDRKGKIVTKPCFYAVLETAE